MTGHHPFAELRAKMSPEARVLAEQKAREFRRDINLTMLRQALDLTQVQVAKKMRVKQPEVAKIEKRADMLLSTLAATLRAMGAELKIIASFPDHDIHIQSLGKLKNGARASRVAATKKRTATSRPRRMSAKTHVAG